MNSGKVSSGLTAQLPRTTGIGYFLFQGPLWVPGSGSEEDRAGLDTRRPPPPAGATVPGNRQRARAGLSTHLGGKASPLSVTQKSPHLFLFFLRVFRSFSKKSSGVAATCSQLPRACSRSLSCVLSFNPLLALLRYFSENTKISSQSFPQACPRETLPCPPFTWLCRSPPCGELRRHPGVSFLFLPSPPSFHSHPVLRVLSPRRAGGGLLEYLNGQSGIHLE